ncbi:hypothetical protein JCM1840_002131 [Sporobolomyces johnsonii]
MSPKRTSTGKDNDLSPAPDLVVDQNLKVKPPNSSKNDPDTHQLLPFQRQLLSQLVPPHDAPPNTGDAMLILARGLGLRTVVTTFLKIYDMPEKLVLLVNATPDEERGFAEEVGMRLKVVGFELPESTREKMYKDGGLFSVTSRILIVDMLKNIIPVNLITGLVILHAETVTPTSQEAFIVRIYRKANKIGFLKAFSDQPESFTFGLSPLQTTLMQLKIRDVIICPRFHESVDNDLQKRKADVIELYQPLTPAMLDIQTAIIECMEATLSEIKRSNQHLEVEDLTVENALFRSFDSLVRTQLDPVWHKVGPRTKGLVSDLTTLRKLQTFLLSFDCVRFCRYLETLLSSYTPTLGALDRRERPAWLGTPAADTIFTVARNRVYVQKELPKPKDSSKERQTSVDGFEIPDDLNEADWGFGSGPTEEEEEMIRLLEEEEEMRRRNEGDGAPVASGSGTPQDRDRAAMPPPPAPHSKPTPAPQPSRWLPPGVEPVLEEQPKWLLLSEVLEEIENHMHWAPIDPDGYSNDTTLIMCNSSDTCATLGDYLSNTDPASGGQNMLHSKLRSYFWWKAQMSKLSRSLKRTPGFSKGQRKSSSSATAAAAPTSLSSTANQGKDGRMEMSAALKRKDAQRSSAPPTKRRRVRGGGGVGSASGASHASASGSGAVATFAAATGANPEAFEEDADKLADVIDSSSTTMGSLEAPKPQEEAFDPINFQEWFGLISQEDLVIIRPYLGDEDDRVLEELRPKYVVMYDPDPAFVRRIEAYRAAHQNLAIRVYFLVYKDSVEEQKYLSSIRKEKDAFVKLIHEKGSMAIPHEAEYRPGEEDPEVLRTFTSSRVGGGKIARTEPMKVIVDVREFRSSLPGLLHAGKFEVVPVTLNIGDYIITPDMAVERKSIPDLIQSFNSGRLYQQCELMTAHYKQPILLIEFDEKKSFNLDTYEASRPKTDSANAADVDLRAKLVLLTISFPKLRIIWSSSPYQTVEIFRELKENRDEPDHKKAVLVGLDEDSGGVAAEGTAQGGGGGEAGFNLAPQDMLRSLPGVSSKNYRYLSGQVENLEALTALGLNDVQQLIGNEPGKQLHGFMHSDMFFLAEQ